jgi:predicted heme/steroid binding protein
MAAHCGILGTSCSLLQDRNLFARNGQHYLRVQGDGNLVLYDKANHVLWESGSQTARGVAPFHLDMQPDGNLVLYDSKGKAVWATATMGHGVGPFYAAVQDDRQIVIYDVSNKPTWTSGVH